MSSPAPRGAARSSRPTYRNMNTGVHQARVVALNPSPSEQTDDGPVLDVSRRSPAMLSTLRRTAKQADVAVVHGSFTLETCAQPSPEVAC